MKAIARYSTSREVPVAVDGRTPGLASARIRVRCRPRPAARAERAVDRVGLPDGQGMSSWEITLSAPVGPLSLFLIADRPDWAPLLSDCLLRAVPGASLISAPSWEAASGLVDERRPTVILATPARQPDPARCRLPVVLLLDEAPEALPPGAVDWLPRHGLDPALLQRCLRYVADQQRLKRTMEQLAEQDPLTGIPNPQGFQTLLATRLAESDERLILGHLDLDNFRSVNDSLGQRAGD